MQKSYLSTLVCTLLGVSSATVFFKPRVWTSRITPTFVAEYAAVFLRTDASPVAWYIGRTRRFRRMAFFFSMSLDESFIAQSCSLPPLITSGSALCLHLLGRCDPWRLLFCFHNSASRMNGDNRPCICVRFPLAACQRGKANPACSNQTFILSPLCVFFFSFHWCFPPVASGIYAPHQGSKQATL